MRCGPRDATVWRVRRLARSCVVGVGKTAQRRAGEVVAVDVKLSATVDDDDIAHLRRLRGELKGDLRAAVVITTGPHAYRRPDGIYVVPLALLGP